MHIDDRGTEPCDPVGNRHFALAMQMTDVECQPQPIARQMLPKLVQTSSVSTTIPGSGSKPTTTPRRSACSKTGPSDSVNRSQAVAGGAPSCTTPAQSETQSLPSAAAMSIDRHKKSTRRARCSARGETSVGSCFARGSSRKRAPVSTTDAVPTGQAAGGNDRCRRPDRTIRIQQPVIERQCHAAIADFRQQLQRRRWVVMCKPVGVVTQKHEAHRSTGKSSCAKRSL